MVVQADGGDAMIDRPWLLVLSLSGWLALAPTSHAQKGANPNIDGDVRVDGTCRARFEEMKADGLGGQTPFAVLMERGSLSHDCTVTAFFILHPADWNDFDRHSVYAIKRSYQHARSEQQVRFADSGNCAAVGAAVNSLTELEVARIEAPRLSRLPQRGIIVADGSSYVFWSNQLVNGADQLDAGDITIVASNNRTLDVLADAIGEVSAECWRAAEPGLP